MKIWLPPLLAGLLLCLAANIWAQESAGSLRGTITFTTTNDAVPDAEVVLLPGNYRTTTDADGHFVLDAIPAGEYTVRVRHMSCKPSEQKALIVAGREHRIEINLEPDIKLISGVEISEDALKRKPWVENVVNQQTIEKLPARDVGGFLRSEPNVAGIRKGGGNIDPVIRGFKFAQLNVQNNTGIKIEGGCPNRMDPAASHIDINDISRIEIIKGPYALRYGPVMGAVLNLITEKARPYETFRVHAKAVKGWESNWNGNKEHITVLGGNRLIYFALSGNHQEYGNYTAGNGQEVKSAFKKYNFAGELGIRPAEHHEVRFSAESSHGRDIRFPTLPMDEREDNTTILSGTYRYRNSGTPLSSIDLKLYRSDVDHEMDNKWRPFSDTVVAVSRLEALNQGGRLDLGFVNLRSSLHLGLDYEDIHKDGQRWKNLIMQPGLPVKTEDLWRDARITNLGVFAEYKREQSMRLEWILSGRMDLNKGTSAPLILYNMMGSEMYHNDRVDSDFTNLSVSAGLSWELSDKWLIDFALGRGVRNPDMVERFIILLPVGYDNYDYLGNPQLKPEKNQEADLTFHFENFKTGAFKLNGFFSWITDYITGVKLPPSQVMPQTKDVLGVKQFQNIDKAFLYGFEFGWVAPAQYRFGGSLTAAYTAGVNPEAVKYLIEGGQVVGSEKVKNDPLPEIPPLEANLRLFYRMFENTLRPEFRLRMVAAQNRISQAYDEVSTPGFVTASLHVNFIFNDVLTLAGGVNNIFDKAYYEHLNRRIIGSNLPLFEPGRIFYLNLILNI